MIITTCVLILNQIIWRRIHSWNVQPAVSRRIRIQKNNAVLVPQSNQGANDETKQRGKRRQTSFRKQDVSNETQIHTPFP